MPGEHTNAWVVVPAGVFLTGKVDLASHVYLVLMPGGVLQGSSRQTDYGDDWVSLASAHRGDSPYTPPDAFPVQCIRTH